MGPPNWTNVGLEEDALAEGGLGMENFSQERDGAPEKQPPVREKGDRLAYPLERLSAHVGWPYQSGSYQAHCIQHYQVATKHWMPDLF